MTTIKIPLPDETLLALRLRPEALTAEFRMVAAVKLYELERLSAGAAAKVAGVPKPVFLSRLGEYGVTTFRFTKAELARDFKNA